MIITNKKELSCMKKILIINEELNELKNSRVILKKGKTIIKDRDIINDKNFIEKYKKEIEEKTSTTISIVAPVSGEQLVKTKFSFEIKK